MIKNPPPWPDGARCAVGFSVDVDAELVVHAAHGAKALDLPHAIAHMRYDPAVGLPRLVDLFAEHGIPLTCFMPGWVIDSYPAAAEYVLRHGRNEVAHHGHLHLLPNQQSLDAQRREIEEGTRRIERLTGKPPRGYRAPYYAASRHTFDLLIEAGFDYDAHSSDGDRPFQAKATTCSS
jgi:peptidoglycan-N-acetylglucosamine deacetylase